MTAIPSASSGWPAGLAFLASAIFASASAGTNLFYGWGKGISLCDSLVWAGVSLGVSIVFALSWPALIRSLDAKRYGAAAIAFVAMVLSGAYSVTAALGSASGGRTNAAAAETATTDARTKAQAAYDIARAELDGLAVPKPAAELQMLIDGAKAELTKLPLARPVAEIEAIIRGAARNPRGPHGCTALNGSLRMSCPRLEAEKARAVQRDRLAANVATWTTELARIEAQFADQRSRLKGEMDRARGELAKAGPPRLANSDAAALAGYLQALGLSFDIERINKLLVLLAVLVLECGGGLSLAVGLTLVQAPAVVQDHAPTASTGPALPARRSMKRGPQDRKQRGSERAQHVNHQKNRSLVRRAQAAQALMDHLQNHAQVLSSERELAAAFGASRSTVRRAMLGLAAQGDIRRSADRRGSRLALAG
jgi:hypothetical protein